MSKFKVGDRVIALRNIDNEYFTRTHSGIVMEIGEHETIYIQVEVLNFT